MHAVPGDLGQPDAARAVARKAAELLGGIDYLVNNAGATVPLRRVGEPSDYAEVIVYLCAGAAYITGEVIPVTGGLRL